VRADPESKAKAEHPMTKADGTALTFAKLLELGKTNSVSYLKVMTCNNLADPLGMGLWEGVPLRDILWKIKPDEKVRRVHYHGFHNDDPKRLFRSSLSINRVFEDPPGEQPVMLCYKLNGELLSPDRGGPVRMIVPEYYGFKSVKWLSHVQVTDNHLNNDTYAEKRNDVDSPMKTFARILHFSEIANSGKAIPLTGVAQCGASGLSKVQYWLKPLSDPMPTNDPYFKTAPWKDAEILPLPENEKLPTIRHQINADGRPITWPLRNTIAHFATLLTDIPKGDYELRVRTIDGNGIAQPMPRPFRKSGGNSIQRKLLTVLT
ncbi:MAG: molybdopterin-dependent oxidoreductase, partial [Methylococcales bacterium]|nr:molybdopterin-dependent oxidoreductase [Methylococcales bacterium]